MEKIPHTNKIDEGMASFKRAVTFQIRATRYAYVLTVIVHTVSINQTQKVIWKTSLLGTLFHLEGPSKIATCFPISFSAWFIACFSASKDL